MADIMIEAETFTLSGGLAGFDGCQVTVIEPGQITSVAPFKGANEHVSAYLDAELGLGLPETGTAQGAGGCEIAWMQDGQWMVFGPEVACEQAAVTDQTDGWIGFAFRGVATADVLSRLCPVDLRDLGAGRALRTDVAHRMGLIITKDGGVDVWVMRSLARDFGHHANTALKAVAAISTKMDDF